METQVSSLAAKRNDRFRGICIDVFYTNGVRDGVNDLLALSRKVESFNRLTKDNDPYGEHDFGALFHEGN
jgi:hypothetical protein